MSLTIAPAFLSFLTVGYAVVTGLNNYGNNLIEDKNKIFLNAQNRRDRYEDYNNANMGFAIALFIANLAFIIYLANTEKYNLTIIYIYALFFLLAVCIYYLLIGILTILLVRMDNKYISTQGIINCAFSLVILIFIIIIIRNGKANNLKLSNSNS